VILLVSLSCATRWIGSKSTDVLEVFKRWWNTHHTRSSVTDVDTRVRYVAIQDQAAIIQFNLGHRVVVNTGWSVPVVTTTRPRQLTSEGGEQVVDGPADDDAVVERHVVGDQTLTEPDTCHSTQTLHSQNTR